MRPGSNKTRRIEGLRLAWYGATPDDAHWFQYWAHQLESGGGKRRIPDRDELLTLLREWLPQDSPQIEAGCGAGDYVMALNDHGYPVEGVEISADLVALVNQHHPGIEVRAGDVLAIDRPDGHYQAYISLGVIEHRQAGPEPFLDEAWRVLAPGGVIVVAVPGYGTVRSWNQRLRERRRPGTTAEPTEPFFQYGFSRSELEGLIRSAGFEVTDSGFVGAYRMLVEEVPGFQTLTNQRGGSALRRGVERMIGPGDGHLIVVRGQKATAAVRS